MLYWFFVKGLGPIAIHRLGPTAQGLENIPREGGAIIAANHLAVIDDALLPLTCPRMIHFMGKAEYFEGKGIKGKFKKWWFTSVGVFPVDRSGGSKSLGALNHAREIIEDGHLFGIHIEGTRSPDGRLYKGHTGAARLAFETGCPIIPAAIIGTSPGGPATSMAQQHLRNVFVFADMPTMQQPEGFIRWTEGLIDADGQVGSASKEFLNKYMDKFLAWVQLHQKR